MSRNACNGENRQTAGDSNNLDFAIFRHFCQISHSPNFCHFRQCVHFWTYLDTRFLSRSKRENPENEVVTTTYGDGYHIFPPKWRWFTRAHYIVLRKSRACSRPLLRGLYWWEQGTKAWQAWEQVTT